MKVENIHQMKLLGGLAYADDSAWIASNKIDLQEIMNIANSLFSLNDIKINIMKCDLFIDIGKKKYTKIEKRRIKSTALIMIGNPPKEVKFNSSKERIRYLGVWIEYNENHSLEKVQITKEIASLV